jgi:hypothetical protein
MQAQPIAVWDFHNKIYSSGLAHIVHAIICLMIGIVKLVMNYCSSFISRYYRNIYKILILNLKFDKEEYNISLKYTLQKYNIHIFQNFKILNL